MADSTILNKGATFDIHDFTGKLAQELNKQGLTATSSVLNENGATVLVEKNMDGFKKFIGLGISLKVNITVVNGTVTLTYTDAEWTNKIIAYIIGAFISAACIGLALVATAIVGTVNQLNLPKTITAVATTIAAGY